MNIKKLWGAKIKFKDTLFCDLFGKEGPALELYNAIEGTNYGPETVVRMVTLQNILYAAPVNDVAFTIDGKLVILIEHQSTVNRNMPLRMLLYLARIYEQLTKDIDKYRRDPIKIPWPEFIVLYNGPEDMPDVMVLKLSDLFAERGIEYPINLELTVRVYNINKGRNPEMAKRSPTLNGYEVFTAKVREYRKTAASLEQAVDRATEECIKEGFLADYLQTHRKAVRNMLTGEWKLDDALMVREMEGEVRGRLEGRLEARREFVNQMFQGGYSVAEIMKVTGLSEKDVNNIVGL